MEEGAHRRVAGAGLEGAAAAAFEAVASPRHSGAATGRQTGIIPATLLSGIRHLMFYMRTPSKPQTLCSTAHFVQSQRWTVQSQSQIFASCRRERPQVQSPAVPPSTPPPPPPQQQQTGPAAGAPQRGAAKRADHLLNFQRYNVSSPLWRRQCITACTPLRIANAAILLDVLLCSSLPQDSAKKHIRLLRWTAHRRRAGAAASAAAGGCAAARAPRRTTATSSWPPTSRLWCRTPPTWRPPRRIPTCRSNGTTSCRWTTGHYRVLTCLVFSPKIMGKGRPGGEAGTSQPAARLEDILHVGRWKLLFVSVAWWAGHIDEEPIKTVGWRGSCLGEAHCQYGRVF